MIIRIAAPADLPTVGEIDALSQMYAYQDVKPADYLATLTPQARTEAWTERRLNEADTHHLLVAEEDGQIKGFCYVGPGQDPAIGELYALFVHPDALGGGVAKPLQDAGLTVLSGLGYRRFLLYVAEENHRARRFYEKTGWYAEGEGFESRGAKFLKYLHD